MSFEEMDEILKSPLDTNAYKAIKLPNGLTALLISTCDHTLDQIESEVKVKDKSKLNCVFNAIKKFNQEHLGIPNDSSPSPTKSPSESRSRSKPGSEPSSNSRSKSKSTPTCHRSNNEQLNLALIIESGMLNDTLPGMAHFVEHLFFLSSEKYPEKEDLTRFLNNNDADCNAQTWPELTLYRFSIGLEDPDVFDEAFDRFVDLLLNPIFDKKEVLSELNSMDSEFWETWTMEEVRYVGLLHHFATEGHPLSKYGMGNGNSLKVENLHELAKEWMKDNYTPNNMVVALQSKMPLDFMVQTVVKYFSKLPLPTCDTCLKPKCNGRKKIYKQNKNKEPFSLRKWNRCYHTVPSRDDNWIKLSWYLPPELGKDWETKPLDFVAYLMGLKTNGGLDNYLKEKGWLIKSCSKCPLMPHMTTGFCSIFSITYWLTEEGFCRREEVIRAIFNYISMLKSADSTDLQRIFDQVRQLHADCFHFKSDSNLTDPGNVEEFDSSLDPNEDYENAIGQFGMSLLEQEFKDDPKYILVSKILTRKWDLKLIKGCLNILADPLRANLLIGSRSFDNNSKMGWTLWYHCKFRMHLAHYLTNEFVYLKEEDKTIQFYKKRFKLPTPEPKKSLCFPLNPKDRREKTFCENNKFKIYLDAKKCRKGYLSTGRYAVEINSEKNLQLKDPRTYPSLLLFVTCFESLIETKLGCALNSLTTLQITFDNAYSLLFELKGPSSNLLMLYKQFLTMFTNFSDEITPCLLSVKKQNIVSDLEEKLRDSEQYGKYIVSSIFSRYNRKMSDYLRTYKDLGTKELQKSYEEMKSKMQLRLDMEGCILLKEAEEAAKITKEIQFGSLGDKKMCKNMCLKLPLGERCVRILSKNTTEVHHWVFNCYQIGHDKKDVEICNKFLYHMVQEAYLIMRTQWQLGYYADVTLKKFHCAYILQISVAALAHRFTPEYLGEKIQEFLSYFYQHCVRCGKTYKKTIDPYGEEWIRRKHVEDFFNKFLFPSGRQCRMLTVQVVGNEEIHDSGGSPGTFGGSGDRQGPKKGTKLKQKVKKYRSRMKKEKGQGQAEEGQVYEEYRLDKMVEEMEEENGYFITDVDKFRSGLEWYKDPDCSAGDSDEDMEED